MSKKNVQKQKYWHLIEIGKRIDFCLVYVVGQGKKSGRKRVRTNDIQFQVPQSQLLPYCQQSPKLLKKLNHMNYPSVHKWITDNIQLGQMFLQINKITYFDLSGGSSNQLKDRFLKKTLAKYFMSTNKVQYLCLVNLHSQNNNHLFLQSFLKQIGSSLRIWPYKLSLSSLSQFYSILFGSSPYVVKLVFQQDKVMALKVNLLNEITCQQFTSQGTIDKIILNAPIFAVLLKSSKEVKRYFKLPYCRQQYHESKNNIQFILNNLQALGMSIGEASNVIMALSVIMNLIMTEVVKKNNRIRFKQKTVQYENLCSLLNAETVNCIQQQIQEGEQDSVQLYSLRLRLYTKIIYDKLLKRIVKYHNQNMISKQSTFQNMRQFNYVYLPAEDMYAMPQPQTVLLHIAHNNFVKLALQSGKSLDECKAQRQFNIQQIKDKNNYDINKPIINRIEMLYQSKKTYQDSNNILHILRNITNVADKRESFGTVYQQIIHAKFINFVLVAPLVQNLPPKSLMQILLQNLPNKQSKTNSPRANKQVQDNLNYDEYIEINPQKFINRYRYCQVLRSKLDAHSNDISSLKQKLTQQNIGVLVHPQKQLFYIKPQLFDNLQKQRQEHQTKINKIQNHFKRAKFRWSVNRHLKMLYSKIKINRMVEKKVLQQWQHSMKQIKRYASCKILQNLDKVIVNNNYRKFMNKISKINSCNQILQILKHKQSMHQVKQHFLKKTKQFVKQKNIKQAIQIITTTMSNIKQNNFKRGFQKISQPFTIVVSQPNNIKPEQKQNQPQHFIVKKQQPNTIINKAPIKRQQDKSKIQVAHQNSKHVSQTNNIRKEQQLQQKQEERQQNKQVAPAQFKKKPNLSIQVIRQQQNQSEHSLAQHSNNPVNQHSNNTLNINPNNRNQQNIQSNTRPTQLSKVQVSVPQQAQRQSSYLSFTTYQSVGSQQPSSVKSSPNPTAKITKQQLYSMNDSPKFTFQTWFNSSVGFHAKKPKQNQNEQTVRQLFSKRNLQKHPCFKQDEQLNVDILLKQKIVLNTFFPYLSKHIEAKNEEDLQDKMSHQTKHMKIPLLKQFPVQQYPDLVFNNFNNLMKIGKDKNTSKSLNQLVNLVVKPIRQSYIVQRKNISTVFSGEPPIIADYSWKHNLIKDEIFLQFIKQIMVNSNEESLTQLTNALEIITRYYYPSPQFIYSFLHFLKSLQSKGLQRLNRCYDNVLLFAQALERYKGNKVTVFKQELSLKQKQSYWRLQQRMTQISAIQMNEVVMITIRLLNEQKYEFKVRNQPLSYFKRKILKKINFQNYQQYFGLYFLKRIGGDTVVANQNLKGIDFLNQFPQIKNQNILYLKLKFYFPFNLKQINKTRIMYMNSIMEERKLPWKTNQYQNIVALAMLFDQYQQYRLSNYLIFSNQLAGKQPNLESIQKKYTQLVNKKGQKINQFQYFKQVKQSNFIAAKAYNVLPQQKQSAIINVSKVIIKPLQILFYENTQLKSSVSLKRIVSRTFDEKEIILQIDGYHQNNPNMCFRKSLYLNNIQRISELHADISAYMSYLKER